MSVFLIFLFISYLREREHMRGRLREKRQSLQPTALLNSEPDVVLDPMTLRSQPTLKPRVGHLVD